MMGTDLGTFRRLIFAIRGKNFALISCVISKMARRREKRNKKKKKMDDVMPTRATLLPDVDVFISFNAITRPGEAELIV